ncbi:MAG: aminopeptidase P family protein [Actinomycetota bacterium]|nr:aminopeptidase P family protein [Actinomycetota bacterium]
MSFDFDNLVDEDAVKVALSKYDDDAFLSIRQGRLESVVSEMEKREVDVLILSLGADLPWLCGYEAMPLERLTALVVTRDAQMTLVVPELEAPRVREMTELFDILPWKEGGNPFSIVGGLVGHAHSVAVSDRMWASALLSLQAEIPSAKSFVASSSVISPLRSQKDEVELLLLARAAHITDHVAESIFAGEISFLGKTEKEISDEISRRLVAEGLSKVNFAIVGSGPNSASPHHEPSSRRIEFGDSVVLDFGGMYNFGDEVGYCSDTTRTVVVGESPDGFADLYSVLESAQERARNEVTSHMSGAQSDALAREVISEGGYGEYFIHRTGHGIGIEEHEEPYLVVTNEEPLGPFAAFSIEPGIYIPSKFGARIEDIHVVGEHRGASLNRSDRSLHVVE